MDPSQPDRPLVLVVEDEVLVRSLISDLLQDSGFKTIEAADPAEALALLESRTDILVMVTDVNMPGLDGFALARHVAGRWPDLEIIVSSGRVRPDPGDLPEGALFIPKPWSNEVMARRVREAAARTEAKALSRHGGAAIEAASPVSDLQAAPPQSPIIMTGLDDLPHASAVWTPPQEPEP